MRGALAIVVSVGLLLVLALSAAGAEPHPRPSATAMLAAGTVGDLRPVEVTGTDAAKKDGDAHMIGLDIDNGESAARSSAADGTAHATAVARTVSLLGGRVTAYGVRRVADATLDDGVEYRGRVAGLVIDGQSIGDTDKPATYPLADGAGTVVVNRKSIGLRLQLTSAASGLPAGTDIRVAVARAHVLAPRATPTPTPTPTPSATPTATPAAKQKPALKRRRAPSVRKRLTRGGFAFPVYGKASVADNFGAARAAPIVSHEGDDIFADFGSPVVAVTDGRISRVGTLDISGNRLWLTSKSGDAFFYAHLSAFAPAAVNGRHVTAGTVLGFVGNTGDAEPTPPHLHFEVHPGGEERPAVDPYPILTSWQGRRDVASSAWLQRNGADTTERPGALVAVRDFLAE
jgi:murein DD-endopeptidase MepM/ murein hydrolase activator NlpD